MKITKRTFTGKEYYNTAYKNCTFIRLSQSNAKKLTRSNESSIVVTVGLKKGAKKKFSLSKEID